ncbi:FecR family protein [Flavobacterium sp.]|uniref:FecR family protein n=1 Tax=Flavobacterium sp. TaxID=239 RepID=UPI00261302EE|nr:FecR domain-containing protein [Flavobacterium sp.]
MKDIFSISTLIVKKKLKLLSDSEKFRLKQLKKQFPISKEVDFDYIVEKLADYSTIDNDKAWQSVLEKCNKRSSKSVFLVSRHLFFRYAAILVCLLGVTYYFITYQASTQVIPKDAIVLQLENGDLKIISSNGDEKIYNSEGEMVGVKKENELTYGNNSKNNKLIYNELKIPFGKRFQVVLSDGTKVHLNSGSTLKFPVKFVKGNKRIVYLSGEAFFEVSKDKLHPFIVQSNGIDVRVLGTKFNVTSYPKDNMINAVLVEGSVQVYNTQDTQHKATISPGEKASCDRTNKDILISKVDVDLYTAWTHGQLVFKGTRFKDMILKLERTYNVSITSNNKELNEEVFSANFNMDIDTVEHVLYFISKSHPFTFTRTENKIIINKLN